MKRLNQPTGSPIRPAGTPNAGPTRGSRNRDIVRQFTRLSSSRSPQTQTQPVVVPSHKSPVTPKSHLAEMLGRLRWWVGITGLLLIYFIGQGNAKGIHQGVSRSTEYPNAQPANRQGPTNVSPSVSTGTLTPSQKTLPWPTPNNFDRGGAPPSLWPRITPEASGSSTAASTPLDAGTLTVPAPAWPLLGLPGMPSRAFPAPGFLERWFPEPPRPFPDPALVASPLSPNADVEDSSGARSQKEITSETRTLGDTAHADRAQAMGFVGSWAPNLGDCHSGTVRRAPLTITVKRAKTSGGVCEFGSVQRDSDGWRVQAICTAGEKSWSASIRLMPKGNRLTWSNERVTEVFVRCSGSRG
jgi:hypothetical protein